MLAFEQIKSIFSIRSILKWPDSKRVGPCPIHENDHRAKTPSFSIFRGVNNDERWKCHSPNCPAFGGTCDVIDLIGYLSIPGYKQGNSKHYIKAAEELMSGVYRISPPAPPPPTPILPNWLWAECLPASRRTIEYAMKRGLTRKEIDEFRIGTLKGWALDYPYNLNNYDQWMVIPTFHHDELMGIKLRNMGDGPRYMSIKGSKASLWGYNDVYLKPDVVILAKGEIAAMVLRRYGFLSCALTSGEGGRLDHILFALSLAKVIVIGDNDKAGREAGEKRAALLAAPLYFPPEKYKDIDEFLVSEPFRAAEVIRKWTEER